MTYKQRVAYLLVSLLVFAGIMWILTVLDVWWRGYVVGLGGVVFGLVWVLIAARQEEKKIGRERDGQAPQP